MNRILLGFVAAGCILLLVAAFLFGRTVGRNSVLSSTTNVVFDTNSPAAKAFMSGLLQQCEALAIPAEAEPAVMSEQARINLWSRLLDIRARTGIIEEQVNEMRSSCSQLHQKIAAYEDLSETIALVNQEISASRISLDSITREIKVCGGEAGDCPEGADALGTLVVMHTRGADAALTRLEELLAGEDETSAIGQLKRSTNQLQASVTVANTGLTATVDQSRELMMRLDYAATRVQVGEVIAVRRENALEFDFALQGDTPPGCNELVVFVTLDGEGVLGDARSQQSFRVSSEQGPQVRTCSARLQISDEELKIFGLIADPGNVVDIHVLRVKEEKSSTIELAAE